MAQYTTEALERGLLLTLIQMAANEAPIIVDALTERVQSTGDDEKHEWLAQPPQMTEFKGAQRFDQMSGTGFTLANITYASAVQILRDHLADNRSGSIRMRLMQLVNVATAHAGKLVVSTLTDNAVGYDGVSLFNDTHPERNGEGGTQDNLLAGTGVTLATVAADVAAARAALLNFTAENGEPFHGDGFNQMVFVCSPALEKVMREVLNSTLISNTTNVQAGMGELIVQPRLTGTDANDWYAFVTDPTRKPLIFQERQALEAEVIAEGSELWIRDRLAEFSVSGRYACGPGFWQSAVKTVNA